MVICRAPSYGRIYTYMPCIVKSIRHVLRCRLLAKKCCQYLRSDPCTRGSNVFRHIRIFCLFNSSCQQVCCGFHTVAYVFTCRFMLWKAGIFSCSISLVSLAGWRLDTGWTDGFRFSGGIKICFDKSHVPAVGSNQLHIAVVAPGWGAFLWT
jgi:hypothetical protein